MSVDRSADHPPRIGPIDPDGLDGRQAAVFEAIRRSRGHVGGPFSVLLHIPALAERVQRLGFHVRYESELTSRSREIAILVTARRWECSYEWDAHEPIAWDLGISEEVTSAIRRCEMPVDLSDEEAAVHEYVRELASDGFVKDPTYQRALSQLGRAGVIELTALVGYYTMLAMTLNAHRISR